MNVKVTSDTIVILGAGSWGTAVAIHLAKNNQKVILWGHDSDHIIKLRHDRCNSLYLPKIKFPENLQLTADLNICDQINYIIIAVPSHAFIELINKIALPKLGISWLTKGLQPQSNALFSEIIATEMGNKYPVTVISGPSFAIEVANGLPTALTLASNNIIYQKKLQKFFHHDNLRVYLSNDIIGVQLCGSIKNVIAIACGISDGLGYGANARAALITRGLVEMRRLGCAMGAHDTTFNGLAGIGDLVLTCTDNQSRNRRFGLLLGQGKDFHVAQQEIRQVIEGKHNAEQIYELAQYHNLDLPICEQVYFILIHKITPQQAVVNLMHRTVNME